MTTTTQTTIAQLQTLLEQEWLPVIMITNSRSLGNGGTTIMDT